MADEDVSNSLQDMTLDAGKSINTSFILHDVFSDHERHVLLKTLNIDTVFTLAAHVLNVFVYDQYGQSLPAFHASKIK